MKNRTIILKSLVLLVALILLLLDAGPLRCEHKSDSVNAQYQAKYADRNPDVKSDAESQDHKSSRFKEIEWIIMQNLIKKYERLEAGDQEDIPA